MDAAACGWQMMYTPKGAIVAHLQNFDPKQITNIFRNKTILLTVCGGSYCRAPGAQHGFL